MEKDKIVFTDDDLKRLKEDGLIISFEGPKYFGTVEFSNEKVKALLARLEAAENACEKGDALGRLYQRAFPENLSDKEREFINAIEAWRKAAGK